MTEQLRNMVGYGQHPPQVRWPNNAKVAVQFVLNYEEGAESCVLDGDLYSEVFLSEIIQAQPYPQRHMSMESIYEYGSRVGVWRIFKEFQKRGLPLTVFGVAMALKKNAEFTSALVESGYEICCHGYRWLHYQNVPEHIEKIHIEMGLNMIGELTGQMPVGWYTGRDSPNTRRLLVEQGGLLYDSDYYGDDLPFWMQVTKKNGAKVPHLIVPYTLDTNDMRFCSPQGFNTADHYAQYCIDAFNLLYQEGKEQPKMLSIGMHARILGRPARFVGLLKILDHLEKFPDVWVATRLQIAQHWKKHHPFVEKIA